MLFEGGLFYEAQKQDERKRGLSNYEFNIFDLYSFSPHRDRSIFISLDFSTQTLLRQQVHMGTLLSVVFLTPILIIRGG